MNCCMDHVQANEKIGKDVFTIDKWPCHDMPRSSKVKAHSSDGKPRQQVEARYLLADIVRPPLQDPLSTKCIC